MNEWKIERDEVTFPDGEVSLLWRVIHPDGLKLYFTLRRDAIGYVKSKNGGKAPRIEKVYRRFGE